MNRSRKLPGMISARHADMVAHGKDFQKLKKKIIKELNCVRIIRNNHLLTCDTRTRRIMKDIILPVRSF